MSLCKALFQKVIKITIVLTHWTANRIFQCGSGSYMFCVINIKMFTLTGPKTPEKDCLGFFFPVQPHNTLAKYDDSWVVHCKLHLQWSVQPEISASL